MKKAGNIILAVALAFVLTACSIDRKAESGADSGKQTHIRMQIAWASDTSRGKAVREILDQFEKENPDIKVEMIGSSQHNQKLLTQILSGNAPEVLQVPYGDLRSLAPQGAFVDLTKELGREKDNHHSQLWNLVLSDGKVYGLPWLGHTVQLIYNKTLFDKAGIKEPPKTWEELYKVAKKLTVDKNGDGKPDQYGIGLVGKQTYDIGWMVDMFVYQAGGKLVKENGKGGYQVAINSPEGKKALEFYKKLLRETAPPDSVNKDGAAVMADFRNQIVAMEFQGPWGITDIWKAGNKFQVAAAEVPAGPAGKSADVSVYALCIPTGVTGEKLDASIKLIKFLGSKKAQEMIIRGEKGDDDKYYPFRIPIRKDMEDAKFFEEHPEFLVFLKGLEYPSISNPIPQWPQIENEVYVSTLNQVVSGRIGVKRGLEMIEEKGNAIIKQSE